MLISSYLISIPCVFHKTFFGITNYLNIIEIIIIINTGVSRLCSAWNVLHAENLSVWVSQYTDMVPSVGMATLSATRAPSAKLPSLTGPSCPLRSTFTAPRTVTGVMRVWGKPTVEIKPWSVWGNKSWTITVAWRKPKAESNPWSELPVQWYRKI